MKKLVAFLFLVALVVAVWAGERYLAHRGEVRATGKWKQRLKAWVESWRR